MYDILEKLAILQLIANISDGTPYFLSSYFANIRLW